MPAHAMTLRSDSWREIHLTTLDVFRFDVRQPEPPAPPIHGSHTFPTKEETAADPFCEGCGGCSCLPGDKESVEPCIGPPPKWEPRG